MYSRCTLGVRGQCAHPRTRRVSCRRDRARTAGGLHGVCMAYAWCVHGICMRARHMHGTCIAYAWQHSRGYMDMAYAWHMHGRCTVCRFFTHGVNTVHDNASPHAIRRLERGRRRRPAGPRPFASRSHSYGRTTGTLPTCRRACRSGRRGLSPRIHPHLARGRLRIRARAGVSVIKVLADPDPDPDPDPNPNPNPNPMTLTP